MAALRRRRSPALPGARGPLGVRGGSGEEGRAGAADHSVRGRSVLRLEPVRVALLGEFRL
jgi:hypothetical protein